MFVRCAVSAVVFCVAGAAQAGDKPLYQPAPAWVQPAPEPDAAKLTDADPFLVINDQQLRVADGQTWHYFDQAQRIVSAQMMNEVGQVKLPWQPDAGDLAVHRAEILRGGERIDLLASGKRFQVLQREEQLEQRMLNGTLTATMAVEGLRVGDVLRMTYTVTNRDKALQGNVQASAFLLAEPMRAKFARARLSWPVGETLQWRTYEDALKLAPVVRGGFNELDVPLPLAKEPELPGDAPVRFRRIPLLDASSFADWPSVSKALAPLYKTEGAIAPGSPLSAEVAKIAAKSSDPRTRAALALRLVQDEVRYLFTGMDGGNYIPQTPSQTWSVRYGDCKAKTLLLLAMLHELGIEAQAVAAHTELGDQVLRRLPSPGAFNHVLVRATLDGKSLWLDGTATGARLADLDDTPFFRTVLPLRAGGSEPIPMDVREPGRAFAEVDVELDQRAGLNLPSPFVATFVMRGPAAGVMQGAAAQINAEQRLQMGQQMVAPVLGDALINDATLAYDDETALATVKVSGIVGSQWKQDDGRYRLVLDKTIGDASFEPDRARTAWKDIPAATGGVATVRVRMRVRLPGSGAGYALEGDQTLPATIAGARTTRITRLAGGEASVDDTIRNLGIEVPAGEIPARRAELALAKTRLLKIAAPEDYPARWKVVQQTRATGGFAPILQSYAKAIANDPKDANAYRNRAAFLSGVWDWKGAIADLDKAIAIEPDAGLHLSRSYAKESLRDDAGALADAQAALTLDPGSVAAVSRVAVLRFRKGERDAALAMVAERVAAGGDGKAGYIALQADLLGEAQRPDEAIAALDAAIKASPGKPFLLNSRCWLKGTRNVALDTGLKDCTRAIEMAEEPASIYDSRAMIYYRMGRMDDALADLDAALRVSPSQSASLFLRGVVRTRAGDKAAGEDLVAARLISPRIDEEYARYGIKP